MFKKLKCGIMAVLVCVVGLSGCGEATTEVEMPEIVFITSHHDYDENIKGYFITNEGKMKMYDFRNIAWEIAICFSSGVNINKKNGLSQGESISIIMINDVDLNVGLVRGSEERLCYASMLTSYDGVQLFSLNHGMSGGLSYAYVHVRSSD